MLHTKFQPNIRSRSGDKMAIVIVVLFLVTAAILNSRPNQIYYSETLESDHAAYEI